MPGTERIHPDPQPAHLQAAVYADGLQGKSPAFPYAYKSWEKLAHAALPKTAWGYVHGSAGEGTTDDANKAAFSRYGLVPRRLVRVEMPDLKTRVFGETFDYPIALAPIGVHSIFHRDKEPAVARAAAELGITYTMSTASSTSIEDAASASAAASAATGPSAPRWYQLYWPAPQHNAITLSLLARAHAAGFSALVVTLDTYILGWRPSDLDTGYNPFLVPDRTGVEIGLSDPVFGAQWAAAHGGKQPGEPGQLAESSPAWARIVFPGASHAWEDLAFLREHWKGPIVLKGIQTVADARRAVDAKMDGIVVSNHGGRQVDGSVPSLDCLAPIVKAVGGELEVMFDSGVRSGADVCKALALGAKMVFVGRPYIYGLAMGGQAGVKHVLGAILADVDLTMQLSGYESVGQLQKAAGEEGDEAFVRRIGV
jgi:isopentenyl diphosphate isomerase/L-lactate dehydrogenase-like FMN-dependent dehydrogenase